MQHNLDIYLKKIKSKQLSLRFCPLWQTNSHYFGQWVSLNTFVLNFKGKFMGRLSAFKVNK